MSDGFWTAAHALDDGYWAGMQILGVLGATRTQDHAVDRKASAIVVKSIGLICETMMVAFVFFVQHEAWVVVRMAGEGFKACAATHVSPLPYGVSA